MYVQVLSLNSEAIRQQKGQPLIGHLVVMQAV
jgi:predicted TPR repeat methyltransferase